MRSRCAFAAAAVLTATAAVAIATTTGGGETSTTSAPSRPSVELGVRAAREALALWDRFPAGAKPRPIVIPFSPGIFNPSHSAPQPAQLGTGGEGGAGGSRALGPFPRRRQTPPDRHPLQPRDCQRTPQSTRGPCALPRDVEAHGAPGNGPRCRSPLPLDLRRRRDHRAAQRPQAPTDAELQADGACLAWTGIVCDRSRPT